MVIRGTVQDRLWGKTLGAFARHKASGQLTVRQGDAVYEIAFVDGQVVAAAAPIADGMALMLAYRQHLVSPHQVATIEYRRREGADPYELLTTHAGIPANQMLALRRQVIAACTMRTFVLETGDFELSPETTIEIWPATEMPLGGLIYRGVRAHLGVTRLEAVLRQLGGRFELREGAVATLDDYGFGQAELAVVRRLSRGITTNEIAEMHHAERHMTRATIYALASCGGVACSPAAVQIPPRLARGTLDTIPSLEGVVPIVRFTARPKTVEPVASDEPAPDAGDAPTAPPNRPTPT